MTLTLTNRRARSAADSAAVALSSSALASANMKDTVVPEVAEVGEKRDAGT
jgi:hypothetical protein